MKLLNHTMLWLSGMLLLILTAWALIFYLNMIDEVHDSIDDGLENTKLLIIHESERDTNVLRQTRFDEGNYSMRKIGGAYALTMKERYSDTLMYMENEQDFEPVRLLVTSFRARNDQYYELRVISSMVEEDDLIEDLLYSLLALYLIMILSILAVNNLLLKRTWKPFYLLLERLGNFRLEKNETIDLPATNIKEFSILNQTVADLLKSNVDTFRNQKQLIENASHELQTPVAISLSKLQLMVEKGGLSAAQTEELAAIMQSLERLARLNRSLLLLSKIENRQFETAGNVDIGEVIRTQVAAFEDLAGYKAVSVTAEIRTAITFAMNEDLAVMFFTNLIKNAIVHNVAGGTVRIVAGTNSVSIENSGILQPLDPTRIFSRFHHGGEVAQDSTGLGLSIVHSIATLYGIGLHYSYNGMHTMLIVFPETR